MTSGVTMIAEVNFDGKFQRGAHEGGRRERERVDHASLKPAVNEEARDVITGGRKTSRRDIEAFGFSRG